MTDSFERACEEADEKEKKKKETQAQKLAKLAAQRTYRSDDADGDDWQDIRPGGLFHTSDQVAYADVECLGRRDTHRVRARGFRQWLIRAYYQAEGAPPSSEALQQALSLIEAQACMKPANAADWALSTRPAQSSASIRITTEQERRHASA